jgi:glyoxylase-like metal-dependent hydrolase (beta-lactamase superfamily II)
MSTVKVSIFTAGYCTCPEHIALSGGRWSDIRFPAMFVMFEHERYGAMLYDTGYSYRFFDETRRLPNRLYRMLTPVTMREEQLAVNQLAARGVRPGDITRVFISHFHADHVAALGDFPNAQFVFLPQAYDAVKRLHGLGALKHAYLPGLIPDDFVERANPLAVSILKPLPAEFRPFSVGFDLLGDESLLAVELPGHAVGQMGLIARGGDGTIDFFVADAAWLRRSVVENLPPHWIANLLFPDPRAYRATLAGMHTLHVNCPGVRIIPSHCAETLMGAVSSAGGA